MTRFRCRVCDRTFGTKTGASVHATTQHARYDAQRTWDLERARRGEISHREFGRLHPPPIDEVPA